MTIRVLDPTFEESISTAATPNRLSSFTGCSIGLLDNGKRNGREFFDHIEQILRSQYGVTNVLRFQKSDASRPAPAEMIAAATQCDAVISGVGD
ncbi:MAG TPA: hypothetical protein VLL56_09965 [Terriglobia bacterium]|nr:hypothetical protein [Terriglobia bacterium]